MINRVYEEDFKYVSSLKLPWEKLKNKTILVSGAAGFIPSYLVKFLLYLNNHQKTNLKIIGLVRKKQTAGERLADYLKNPDLELIVHDVSKPLAIKKPIHFIIHAASQASPKFYSIDPVGTLKANVLGTYNLLELARKSHPKSLLFISAGEIYGITDSKNPTDEESYGWLDPVDVRSCYAESKRLGETMCISYYRQYQIPTKIVRLYHTYGPGFNFDDGRVFADFVKNIINNENIVLKSDGSAIRSFLYLADAISGFLTILLKGVNGQAYNLANEKATVSIKILAETLINLFPKKKLKLVFAKRAKEDKYLQSKISVNNPSAQKLQALGWKPHFSPEEGFRRTIESYRS